MPAHRLTLVLTFLIAVRFSKPETYNGTSIGNDTILNPFLTPNSNSSELLEIVNLLARNETTEARNKLWDLSDPVKGIADITDILVNANKSEFALEFFKIVDDETLPCQLYSVGFYKLRHKMIELTQQLEFVSGNNISLIALATQLHGTYKRLRQNVIRDCGDYIMEKTFGVKDTPDEFFVKLKSWIEEYNAVKAAHVIAHLSSPITQQEIAANIFAQLVLNPPSKGQSNEEVSKTMTKRKNYSINSDQIEAARILANDILLKTLEML